MDFSDALNVCKWGSKIARTIWFKSGKYVVHQRGYPDGIGLNTNTAEATGIAQGTVCKFSPYLMEHNDQGVFVPWTPGQTDLLAEDWEVVK